MKIQWKCVVCEESFKSSNLLYKHIRITHNKTAKEYYDENLKKPNEGKCLNCGNQTKLHNNTIGYLRFCCLKCSTEYKTKNKKIKENVGKYKCKICNKLVNGLGSHIIQFHHITCKEYYDKYLRKPGEGICPVCGKETTFRGIFKGVYLKHCSLLCSNNDIDTLKLKQNTSMKLYGVKNYRNTEKARITLAKHIKEGKISLKRDITQSKAEIEIIEQIKCYYNKEIIHCDRTVLDGFEIDIWLPDIKFGIEYDGYFWHADPKRFKATDVVYDGKTAQEIWDKDKRKDLLAESKGIKLIRIKESDYNNNRIEVLSNLYKYIIQNDYNEV